ncbi:nitroreductase family protein [Flavonifractor sp. AGMB03687]|uniref:nitroreductase family protein n=1 Tax=Flavonifractor sp. AGMB03687 TaxID=2785133 RepID=UPI001ADFCAA2|nr:nitroreductase family protein [Flavonifractor sp. AGMB03687]
MNDVLHQLHDRKSVRAYLEKPIAQEDKRAILEAACAAPTAGNQQLYTILDITDQQLKNTLADTCDHQPFIAQAPLVLIFCADCQKWYDAFAAGGCNPRKPGVGDLLLACSDANIAAQNAVTAAWSLGIGSCYIGDILEQCETHRKLLGLPEYVVPAAMVVFGYPTAQQQAREKPRRRALPHIVHQNGYRRMDARELELMLSDNAGQRPYADWLQAFCDRKYNSDFSREMSRSAAEYLKAFQD